MGVFRNVYNDTGLNNTTTPPLTSRLVMGFYITFCTVHTTQGQGQVQGTIVFYCALPGPCPCPSPVPCSMYEP